MKTTKTEDHVFHVAEEGDDVKWPNPQFGHRLDWSEHCKVCSP